MKQQNPTVPLKNIDIAIFLTTSVVAVVALLVTFYPATNPESHNKPATLSVFKEVCDTRQGLLYVSTGNPEQFKCERPGNKQLPTEKWKLVALNEQFQHP